MFKKRHKVKVSVEVELRSVHHLSSSLNGKKVFVEWKKGKRKDNQGQSRPVEVKDKSAAWYGESFRFNSTLEQDPSSKSFDTKKVAFSLLEERSKGSKKVGKAVLDLATVASSDGVSQDMVLQLGSKNPPALKLTIKVGWLKFNGKLLVKKPKKEGDNKNKTSDVKDSKDKAVAAALLNKGSSGGSRSSLTVPGRIGSKEVLQLNGEEYQLVTADVLSEAETEAYSDGHTTVTFSSDEEHDEQIAEEEAEEALPTTNKTRARSSSTASSDDTSSKTQDTPTKSKSAKKKEKEEKLQSSGSLKIPRLSPRPDEATEVRTLELEKELEAALANLKRERDARQELEKQLDAKEAALNTLKEENRKAEKQKEEELKGMHSVIEKLQEQVEKLKKQANDKEKKTKKKEAKGDKELQKKNEELASALEKVKHEVEREKEEVTKYKQELERQKKENERAEKDRKEAAKEMEAEIKKLQKELTKQEKKEKKDRKKEASEKAEEAEKLKSEMAKVEQELAKWKDCCKDLEQQKKEVDEAVAAHKATITSLQSAAAEREATKQKQESAASHHPSQTFDGKKALKDDELQVELNRLRKAQDKAEAEIAELKNLLSSRTKELEHLKTSSSQPQPKEMEERIAQDEAENEEVRALGLRKRGKHQRRRAEDEEDSFSSEEDVDSELLTGSSEEDLEGDEATFFVPQERHLFTPLVEAWIDSAASDTASSLRVWWVAIAIVSALLLWRIL
ncbi:Splicing regulatory glutamine/lysine-rich protein 1 [Balamuthia mandrillaris]